MHLSLDPANLLTAYACGIFPMADESGGVCWFAPDPRAIIELEAFKTTRSLRSVVRRGVFEVRMDTAFGEVMRACADRPEGTWISCDILEAYQALHRLGFAHSVEAWRGDRLVGGLYGVALGGAFFGESMFHRATDASKVALVALVDHLRARRFALLDIQFLTEHLRQFGAIEIPRALYERRLAKAVRLPCTFVDAQGDPTSEAR
ncbi:MAG: leucyl/phenylalanyl-tRNA--protein transferase [Phycisphaerae bacterium]